VTASAKALQLTQIAAQAASDKQADNIVGLDVTEHFPLADVFLLASARNERQTASIAEEIEIKLGAAGTKLLRIEGKAGGRWILLDFGDIVCHIMHEEDRMFYSIERLWKDCPVIQLEVENAG
jgi:ribosome-associated protein